MTGDQILHPRITLFLSTCMVLPVAQLLLEKGMLVGVVITPRVDADSVQLEHYLIQMRVPAIRYNPEDVSSSTAAIKSWNSNLGLIATFSEMLPESLISCFEFGMYNIHGSPLPAYRGINPIFWQLKNKESASAVVICKVQQGMDDGGIAISYPFDIHPQDTFGTLSGTIYQLMPMVIQEFLTLFAEHCGKPPLQPQQGGASTAPHPDEEELFIDWHNTDAQSITALVRACNPILGGARIRWKGAVLGVMQASVVDRPLYGVEPGTILHIGSPEGVLVATKNKALSLDVLQMMDGAFTGLRFAERFSLNAGEKFVSQA